jgi:hypothetical protein
MYLISVETTDQISDSSILLLTRMVPSVAVGCIYMQKLDF